MRALSAIPERPSEISAPWLEEALSAPADSLRDFEVTRIGEGAGIVGVISRVSLAWSAGNGSLPPSVVVKLSPDDPVLRTRPGIRLSMEREARFYAELAKECGVRTPHPYATGFEAETGKAAIVMEDFGEATIYETGTAPDEAIVSVGRHIARLHARWWNDPRLAAMDWLASIAKASAIQGPNVRAGVPRVTPWFEANAPDMFELAVLRLEDAERGVFPSPSLPGTLCHGDLALKNVAFVEGEPVLFDWALASKNPGPTDLTALISESFGATVPRSLADVVVPAYAGSLREAGVEGVSEEQIREDFGIALMARLWMPLMLLGANPDAARERIALRWMAACRAFKDEFDFEGRLRRALG